MDVSENTLSLNNNSSTQFGIALNNCMPTTSTTIGKNIITQNTASFSTSGAVTNTATVLIFCGNNGVGAFSPSVSCNVLKQSNSGFIFELTNEQAVWEGNEMSLPMKRGMVLQSSGVIGAQGGTTTASSNSWSGGTWATTNYNTWTEASYANLSKLWVRNSSGFIPNNSAGLPNSGSYATANNNYTFVPSSGTGDYMCGEFPNHRIIRIPLEEMYNNEDEFYMAKMSLYKFLYSNDSVLTSGNLDAIAFVDSIAGSSIDKFTQIEEKLYLQQPSEASAILDSIDDSDFNTIENNYKTFYNLYISYLNLGADGRLGSSDSADLWQVAELCPATNGNCVYQAISLYNVLYGKIIVPNCSSIGARIRNHSDQSNFTSSENKWFVDFFPNPANNQLTLVNSSKEKEELEVVVTDLSGRVFLKKKVETIDFIAKLDLELINGAYIINISNQNNESITKKLLISK